MNSKLYVPWLLDIVLTAIFRSTECKVRLRLFALILQGNLHDIGILQLLMMVSGHNPPDKNPLDRNLHTTPWTNILYKSSTKF